MTKRLAARAAKAAIAATGSSDTEILRVRISSGALPVTSSYTQITTYLLCGVVLFLLMVNPKILLKNSPQFIIF